MEEGYTWAAGSAGNPSLRAALVRLGGKQTNVYHTWEWYWWVNNVQLLGDS